MKYLIPKSVFLHKIDKICINLKSNELEMNIGEKYISPVKLYVWDFYLEAFKLDLNKTQWFSANLQIEEDILKKIMDIFKKRSDSESEALLVKLNSQSDGNKWKNECLKMKKSKQRFVLGINASKVTTLVCRNCRSKQANLKRH